MSTIDAITYILVGYALGRLPWDVRASVRFIRQWRKDTHALKAVRAHLERHEP